MQALLYTALAVRAAPFVTQFRKGFLRMVVMIYESWTGSWYMWNNDVPRMRMDIQEDPDLFQMDITGIRKGTGRE